MSMLNLGSFKRQLQEFYQSRDISNASFSCPFQQNCEEDAAPRALLHGAEAHLGSRYGQIARIVIVSLDVGRKCPPMEERRKHVEDDLGERAPSNLNPHLRGTRALLEALLGEEVPYDEVFSHFAMINAAKCTGADEKKDMVPGPLFKRCLPYAMGELEILAPQLIITQGNRARLVVKKAKSFTKEDCDDFIAPFLPCHEKVEQALRSMCQAYMRSWKVGGHRALALCTPHPSARQGQWKRFSNIDLPPLARLLHIKMRSQL